MQNTSTHFYLKAMLFALITIASTVWLLDTYGQSIIQYQMGHSGLFVFILAQKSVDSGFPRWDDLLPLCTFLICLTGGLFCSWLSGTLWCVCRYFLRSFMGFFVVVSEGVGEYFENKRHTRAGK